MLNLNVDRVGSLPDDLDRELLPAAEAEGFDPLAWLVEEWRVGKNRFDRQGEGLYVARLDRRLLGVCGLNRDPYVHDESTGRLRRLYVHTDHRRQGIGSMLVRRVISDARGHFNAVQLRTLDHHSGEFFETIGFSRLEGDTDATHRLVLQELDEGDPEVGA